MTRIMYDTINTSISDIPPNPQMVAGYVDGLYAWNQADWNRFPDAVKIRIAVFSNTNDGHVLDVEPGNATPAQAPGWVTLRRASGLATPTIYVSEGSWDAVWNQFVSQKVEQPLYWVAQYDGSPVIPHGAIAKQYFSSNKPNFDSSVVADYWPGVDEMPTLTDADAAVILNAKIPRQGANTAGGDTTLGGLVAWNDDHVQTIINAIGKIAAPTVIIDDATIEKIAVKVAAVLGGKLSA